MRVAFGTTDDLRLTAPCADAVVSGSWDQTLRITRIDPSTSQPSPSPLILKLPHKVYALSVSKTKVVCAMGGRSVHIWDIAALKKALDEGKSGEEVEPWQMRESSLKFMTRAVKIMPNEQGASSLSFIWLAGTDASPSTVGYVTTSIEGRVAVEFFDPASDVQAKKYAFKCHRQVIEGVDTVYPVQGLAFNSVYVRLPSLALRLVLISLVAQLGHLRDRRRRLDRLLVGPSSKEASPPIPQIPCAHLGARVQRRRNAARGGFLAG